MTLDQKKFNIHGDNIVECIRTFDYVVNSLGDLICNITGPNDSITCPVYIVTLVDRELQFQFLPGYGEHRWNQDILYYIKSSGGRLREAADAIVTLIKNDEQHPVLAIEFCGALPAGNQAWQRQGRTFSFAHAKIPYFYVAELGGFELKSDRSRKAPRMPNPAVPFSFLAMTKYKNSVCLPVYEANAAATRTTKEQYNSIFGKTKFLEFLKFAILENSTEHAIRYLGNKCIALVKLLADLKKRKDGLTGDQWQMAYESIAAGGNLPDFLIENAQLSWKKTTSIKSLTNTARRFMELGEKSSLGLTSSKLPLSFVPKSQRLAFSRNVSVIYPDISKKFATLLANQNTHLAIAWVMGFKPGGDDARPDRGLPPLARMLIGENCELMTFVYGPVPKHHWDDLVQNPSELAAKNGLWEAIFGVSDSVLVDSSTKPPCAAREYLKESWAAAMVETHESLNVEAKICNFGEQDVDTALHVAFEALGTDFVFEGMCNPPGGDWSGLSFRWSNKEPEYRWLVLPRVPKREEKRPDHVFALFGYGERTVCLCIESKEHAHSLEKNIGPRLTQYAEVLFETAPSIFRHGNADHWNIYNQYWNPRELDFVSVGAHLSNAQEPFGGLPKNTALEIQIGIVFSEDGQQCTLHMRGHTETGRALIDYLAGLPIWGNLVKIEVNN